MKAISLLSYQLSNMIELMPVNWHTEKRIHLIRNVKTNRRPLQEEEEAEAEDGEVGLV